MKADESYENQLQKSIKKERKRLVIRKGALALNHLPIAPFFLITQSFFPLAF